MENTHNSENSGVQPPRNYKLVILLFAVTSLLIVSGYIISKCPLKSSKPGGSSSQTEPIPTSIPTPTPTTIPTPTPPQSENVEVNPQTIAFVRNYNVWMINQGSIKQELVFKDNNLNKKYRQPQVSWNKNEDKILVADAMGNLFQVNLNDNGSSQIREYVQAARSYTDPRWSPDFKKYAFNHRILDGNFVEIHDPNQDNSSIDYDSLSTINTNNYFSNVYFGTYGAVFFHGWFPDSINILVYLVASDNDRGLYKINIENQQKTKLLGSQLGSGWPVDISASLSPDGNKIAYTISKSENLSNKELHILDLRNSKTTKIQQENKLGGINWSPNSQKLLYSYKKDETKNLISYSFSNQTESKFDKEKVKALFPKEAKLNSINLYDWGPNSQFAAVGVEALGRFNNKYSKIVIWDTQNNSYEKLVDNGSYPFWTK